MKKYRYEPCHSREDIKGSYRLQKEQGEFKGCILDAINRLKELNPDKNPTQKDILKLAYEIQFEEVD